MPFVGMKFNNRQRAGALVAVLCVAALGVDRFVLGVGGPASASAAGAIETFEGPVLPATAPKSVAVAPTDSLANRLQDFAISESLDPADSVPNLFGEAEWKVQAVFGSGTRGGVRVGDKTVLVGKQWEAAGATLERVTRTGAFFSRGGREFFVPLDQPEINTRVDSATADNG